MGAVLAGLVAACGETPQTAWNPRSEYAIEGLDLFQLIIWMGVVVGVIVEGLLFFAAIRYRRRPGDRLPPQIHGNTPIEVIWTTIPVLIVGFILFETLPVIFRQQSPAPEGSMDVNVIGHQFWWEFQYPNANVVTANEMHLPMGQTVNLVLHSDDVIHSFWIPALGGKRDAFPSHINYIWLTPNSTGEFPGQCYQLCGYSHGNMREKAFVQTQAEFDAWIAAQQQPAVQPTDGDAAAGAQVFQQRACIGCHTIEGTPAQGKIGPNLTHFASRTTFAGSIFENNTQNLERWLKNAPGEKPGSIMPASQQLGINDQDIQVLIAYLQSLR
ncbi:MAG: cytochrome c oxidase subunit II [Chloroflexi bacterium]|nr:cytochrome c oxidase subunit II [Chloroflexota bacterium]